MNPRRVGNGRVRRRTNRTLCCPQLKRTPVVFLAAGLVSASVATAQERVTIDATPSCEGCTLRLTKVATLGAPSGLGELGVQPTINAAGDGRFYVWDTIEPGKILVYDSTGRYVRAFGREGQGPGEYTRPLHVISRGPDTLQVVDVVQRRATTLTADYQVMAVQTLPLSFPRYIELGGGHLVVNGLVQSRSAFGLSLHVLDRSFNVLHSFGPDPTVIPGQRYRQVRALAAAGDSQFWAAPSNRFAVELWDTDGNFRLELLREAPWFQEWTEPSNIPRLARPKPQLVGIHQDADRHLWVLIQLADANYRPGSQAADERILEYPEVAQYYDTIIEVWDISRRRVILSQRVDLHLHPFIGRGLVFSARQEADGIPYYDIWRLELNQNGR